MRPKPQESIPIGPTLQYLGAEYVPTGHGWVRMKCPFHEDRNASASVNHESNGFQCHANCGSGDAVKLLVEQGGLSHREAFAKARELAGMEPNSGGKPQAKKRRASDILSGG